MSLRYRLVAGFALVALALLGFDVVVSTLVHRTLIRSLDSRLVDRPGGRRLGFGFGGPGFASGAPPGGSGSGGGVAPIPRGGVTDLYTVIVSANGTVDRRSPSIGGRSSGSPAIPADLAARAAGAGVNPRPFTVADAGGSGDGFRAIAVRVGDNTVLVAVSLHDTKETFDELLLVEVLGTIAVLAAGGLVVWWVLHLGVRPLDEMTRAADAIAAGDLSRRIDRAEPSTEAGRLGLALNAMLAEIQQAFDERSRSEDRLRRFVADASHELRTPLTSIRGYAELWRAGGLDTDSALADAMRRMEQEAARMGVLVDDLLLLARLDQGRPLEAHPVNLAALARDAVADARAVEPGRAIDLVVPERLMVDGDEGRLRQVLANLLANERIHTPPNTPVRVGLRLVDDHAVLVVEDDGPGFGPEPERVFERFYRADPARARAKGGSGLGLSIVAAVTEAHGGRAVAGTTLTGGARVEILLPLVAPAPSGSPGAADGPGDGAPLALAGRRDLGAVAGPAGPSNQFA